MATATSIEAPPGVSRLLDAVRSDGRAVSFDRHRAHYGRLYTTGVDLIAELHASGLRGRGGGAFPCGEKLAAVARQPGHPVVVVNDRGRAGEQ
jgi:NADH:ubiquinone oxidoreductase subunit F (NADH-binding)